MPDDVPAAVRSHKHSRKRNSERGKSRLLTLDDLDLRTRAAQRALELQDKLVRERGGRDALSVLRYEMTKSVALLCAMIEDRQARWLTGAPTDVAMIATLLNARRREAQAIGIDPLPRDVTPDLRDYLAGKRAGEPRDSSFDSSGSPGSPAGAEPSDRAGERPEPAMRVATPLSGTGA